MSLRSSLAAVGRRAVAAGRWTLAVGRRVLAGATSRRAKLYAALGLPYLATLISIGSYLSRGGTGTPTAVEVGLLAGTLGALFLYALGADARGR
ncbi:hypothetical protein GCM10027435_12330 [Haloparvum alkalitolerans]|uniref:hypothetical protein n=1 Tax=Haloparvum alkalitolerans TaxID=1042953 RepID=UPI003CE6D77C